LEDAFYFVRAEDIDTAMTYRPLATCFLDKAYVSEMKLK